MTGAAARRSIEIEGFGHTNPIPAASRIGPLMVSSIVVGYDPGTTTVPAEPRDQVANLFRHCAAILAAAEATWEDIVRMTFYAPSLDSRPAINEVWTQTFPDGAQRPARITHEVDSHLGIRCEFIAYVSTEGSGAPC
jgi:2-iminobutanoate/2-iminopropanoate deaminase